MAPPLSVTRQQVLSYRRSVSALDERLPAGTGSLRTAAWAGLTDSVPRAAQLSIHARVEAATPNAWADPSLVQVWGPRYSTYVVSSVDAGVFTLGRYPDGPRKRRRADDIAARLAELLGDRTVTYAEAGRELGVAPNSLRYATTTGTVLIRWEGSGKPTIRSVPRPDIDPADARLELARRYLKVFGPATSASFAKWAGIPPSSGESAFAALSDSLIPVRTPIGDAWLLAEDEERARAPMGPAAPVRMLPSGDTFYLLQGEDRALLVPDSKQRDLLWTSRVWPGAVLVDGEVAGIWRRAGRKVTIEPWRHLDKATKHAIADEAGSMALPNIDGPLVVTWSD